MKIFKNFIGLAALALCLGFASCDSDDDAPSYSNMAVSNSELMTILKGKGYQFDENGKMLLDDKANSTTSLDLSGTKVDTAALKELSVFPNLKELNLSSNGYGPVFHIASLPSQITGLDLQGNDIYDFDGLVTAKVENDEVKATILHEFTKLYLPASCKYNVEDLMPFYTQNEAENKTVDMQMVNDKGSLEKYNTLREIPDTYFAAYLKNLFASIFVDDTHIDISKPLGILEKGTNISLWAPLQYEDIDKIQSIRGVEYFVNNPFYEDFFVSIGYGKTNFDVKGLMPRNNISQLSLINTAIDYLDLSQSTKMSNLQLSNNDLETLDLSNTLIANQKLDNFTDVGNIFVCYSCKNLKEIKFHKDGDGIVSKLQLCDLPSLKKVDLSSIHAFASLYVFLDNAEDVIYPNFEKVYRNGELVDFSSGRTAIFGISENVYNLNSTKEFIQKYSSNLRNSSPTGFKGYKWK